MIALFFFASCLLAACRPNVGVPAVSVPTFAPQGVASPPKTRGPLALRPSPTPPPTLTPGPTRALTPSVGPPLDPTPMQTLRPSATPDFTLGRELEEPPERIPCEGTGLVYNGRFPSRSVDPWRYYHAYLPPCYGHDGRVYPVLYYMHGSIQNDRHWIDLGIIEYLEAGIQSGRYPPFIVIFPYNGNVGNATSGGAWTVEDITVENLIPYIDEKLCTWREPAGRAIGGISRGGYWALEIAFQYPHLFGAVSGHSPQLRLDVDGPEYNPLVTYAQVDLSSLRIWLDWGERDFLRNGPRELHDKLTAAGIPHEVHVFPGRHNEAYWQAHVRDYLDWHAAGWPLERSAYPFCE